MLQDVLAVTSEHSSGIRVEHRKSKNVFFTYNHPKTDKIENAYAFSIFFQIQKKYKKEGGNYVLRRD